MCQKAEKDEATKKTPKGRELLLVDDEVTVFNKLLRGQRDYMRDPKHQFVQVEAADALIRGFGPRLAHVDRRTVLDVEATGIGKSKHFTQLDTLAMGIHAVVVAGRQPHLESPVSRTYLPEFIGLLQNGKLLPEC